MNTLQHAIRFLASLAVRQLVSTGGFSISPTGRSPVNGFIVSVSGSEQIYAGYPTHCEIAEYIRKNFAAVDDSRYFGGWIDNGKTYLDISVRFADESAAIRAASVWGQLAYYDVANSRSVRTDEYVANIGHDIGGIQRHSQGGIYPYVLRFVGQGSLDVGRVEAIAPGRPTVGPVWFHDKESRSSAAREVENLCLGVLSCGA